MGKDASQSLKKRKAASGSPSSGGGLGQRVCFLKEDDLLPVSSAGAGKRFRLGDAYVAGLGALESLAALRVKHTRVTRPVWAL